ncbi:MAG: COG3014 family protein [bacterium]
MPRKNSRLCVCLLALVVAGCGSHSWNLAAVRTALTAGDVPAAVAEFEKQKRNGDDLLYLLEKGHMLHLVGRWEESNAAFESAELRAEDLYTKSISREAAALITSDLALPYRGSPFELQMVHYYRALNYLALRQPEEALVEARKANERLAIYAEKNDKGEAETLRPEAFLTYVTGLLYESEGEANDAAVALREARRLYEDDASLGPRAPSWLAEDLYAVARQIGLSEVVEELKAGDAEIARKAKRGAENNVIILLESGFVPFREEVNITLPIYEEAKKGESGFFLGNPAWYLDEYGHDIYAYRADRVKLDHVLRFAFPSLVTPPSAVARCDVKVSGGASVAAEPALDLAAAVKSEFDRRMPRVLLKTIARAITKEIARREGKEKDVVIGWLVNAANVATERADTRSWIVLPSRIDIVKTSAPPGAQTIEAHFRDAAGNVIETITADVDVLAGRTTFLSLRSFR